MEQDPMKMLIDAVAEMQGQGMADHTMIEAMLMAHPAPEKLRDCWDRLSVPRLTGSSVDSLTKNRTADHSAIYHFQKWTEKLERHHPRTA